MSRNARLVRPFVIGASLGVAVLTLLVSPRANADVPTSYSAQRCVPGSHAELGVFTKDSKNDQTLHNNSSSTHTLFCPITKYTSGPNVTNDAISSITVQVTSTNLPVQCTLRVRDVRLETGSSNAAGGNDSSTVSTGTLTITTNGMTRARQYWTAQSSHPFEAAWYYAYLECSLPGGATIGTYKVTELGTSTGYTIDPMISCPLTSDMEWSFDYWVSYSDGTLVPSGFVRAQASGSAHTFGFACIVPGNSMTEVAESGGGPNLAGCNLNTTSVDSYAWPISHQGSSFPSEILAGPWQPVIAAPIAVGGAQNVLYCGQNSMSGDSRWLSYRTFPNPSRVGTWAVTASANNADASKAIDNNGGTRWSSNTAGTAGMTFTVDRGPNWSEFNNITLDSGSDADDYARLFTVLISDDNVHWGSLGQYSATNRFTSVTFSEQTARYVRVRLDKNIKDANNYTKYWSIRELNIYFNDGTN